MQGSYKLQFHGKKILVAGLGITGLCTARWLADQGAAVTVSEVKPETDLDPAICNEIRERGIALETGWHREETFLNSEMIVLSPGVPLDMEPLSAARKVGIHVTGELELASRLIDTPMIAVTGTNGKSSVTAFLGSLLENANLKVFVGGNIGTPLIAYVAEEDKADYVVVEVSSFQLDTIETFCPFISMVLNVSPDHLDRYPSYEDYVQSKLRVYMNQGTGQYVILNDDDERLSLVKPSSGVSVFRFGTEKKEGRHAFIEDSMIRACIPGKEHNSFSLKSLRLPGRHNLENLLAVVLTGLILGIKPPVIQQTINELEGLPNRLEQVAELAGVEFYNDSKATNVDAAVKAITSFDRPLILIAGGRHKGADYTRMVRAAEGGVKRAVFLGESRELLARSFEGVVPFSMAEDMDDAVSMAFSEAEKGDVVLLAPACSSFDMFSDYAHRGRVFRAAVERLRSG
jgi:UDP-N-acetylmuramoylalanine--D-glutamate ligase